ncbi:MAG: AAA family ATPase [Burkholderiaceae bacterium]
MADLTKILGGPWAPSATEQRVAPPEDQFREAMLNAGVQPPDEIILDGQLRRFRPDPKKHDRSGWYVGHADGICTMIWGDWRQGIEQTVKADTGRKLTVADEMAHVARVAAAKAARDLERKKQNEAAASTVDKIWSEGASASPEHPYLKRKGIQPHGAKITGDGRLMVPLFDSDGVLASLQYIDADGGKLYHPGGSVSGKFCIIGTMDVPGVLYVAEGFATAATIHEVSGRPVIVAYSASNLVPVTGTLREIHGQAQDIVIVADNDASGVGQKYAEQACAKYGARMVMPSILGDANDYAQAGHDLAGLLNPQADKTMLDKLKVVFGDGLSTDYEAPNELVEDFMTIGGMAVLYGDSNSGKTFFALSLAAHIASGQPFFNRQIDPGLVVYLASEAPGSIRSRMQAIKKHFGCSLENLAMVPVPLNFYANEGDARDVIELVKTIEQIKGQPVRLIIGDTLARMSAGANENSGEDMGPVMARFDSVAQATGSALLIIHHNGKDQAKGARGWSGIRAHIDTEIEVMEKDGIRSATITKQRELPGKGEIIYFRLEVVEMGITKFGKPATTCVAVPDESASTEQPHKRPTKHDENVRTFERAWFNSGAEIREDKPYISRSALRELLISDGMSERTAKNKTEASRSDGLIAPMLNAGTIEPFEHGWVVVDGVQASAMMLKKSAPKCP